MTQGISEFESRRSTQSFVENAENWAERYVRGFDSHRLVSTFPTVVD